MAGRPWFKVWPEKWLASGRVRRLTLYQQGVYWALHIRAAAMGQDGALRHGTTPWTVQDLAYDLGLDRRRTRRLEAALDALVDAGMLDRAEDGAWVVRRWDALQSPSPAESREAVNGAVREVGDMLRRRRPQ